ncbi:hypothetical protein JCM19992_10630 [Thermostilla marina]
MVNAMNLAMIDLQTLSALWAEWGLSIATFVTVVCGAWLGMWIWLRRPQPKTEDQEHLSPVPLEDPDMDDPGAFGPLTPALAAQIPESGKETREFQLLLRQAGLYHPAAKNTIYALRFLLLFTPLVIAGICAVLADDAYTWHILIVGAISAAALSIIPRLYVFFRKRSRMQQIRAGLPDTIDMLSMCATGGLSLLESLDHVAGQLDAYPALAEELRIVKRQTEVGSLKMALADLTRRVDLPEIRQLTALLLRGSQLGTQLAGNLNEQADHLRTAMRQMANTRANKTPVKLVFPILFCLAPAALILLTAPAMLELRDFFVPSPTSTTAPAGATFGTNSILETMDLLDQRADIAPAASDNAMSDNAG